MANKVEYIMSLNDKSFNSTLDGANSKVNAFEANIGRIGKMVAGAFAINAIANFAKEVTTVGAQFDSYEASLATLLGSEKQAHEVFNQIKADAKATPFDTESLVLANRALIGAGEEAGKAREVILDLSNVIAATGGDSNNLKSMAVNLNQIKSIGKASAMDIKQFVFAGIPIYKLLAEATGKNVEEVKEMDVSYDLLTKTLNKAYKGADGTRTALDKMAASTAGQISNLEEAITFLKVDLYNGLKPVIQEVLVAAANFVQVFVDGIQWAKDNKDGLAKVFAPVKKMIDPIINAIGGLVDKFKQVNGEGSMLENIFNKIGSVMLFLEPAFAAVGEMIGAVIDAFGILAVGVMNFVDRFQKPIAGVLTAVRNVFIGIWTAAKHYIGGVANLIGGILSGDLGQIKEGLKSIGQGFLEGNPIAQGINAAKGFSEGYEKGLKTTDFFGDKNKEKESALGGTANSMAASGSAASSSGSKVSGSKVGSAKPTTININIHNLVNELLIKVESLGMDKHKVAAEVSKLFLGVVNDANRLAGL